MVEIIAFADMAGRLVRMIPGDTHTIVSAEDADDLIDRMTAVRPYPTVVIIDYRFGGNAYLALDLARRIRRDVPTHPYVIGLVPGMSAAIQSMAARRGCYDVINVDGVAFATELRRAVDLAEYAHRQRRAPPRPVLALAH